VTILYVIGWVPALIFVTLPIIAIATLAGLCAGGGASAVLAARVLAGRVPEAIVLTDGGVAAGALPYRLRTRSVRWDRAWPHYFAGQAALDLIDIVRAVDGRSRRMWRSTIDYLRTRDDRVRRAIRLSWPVTIGIPVFLAAATVGAAIVVAGIVVISAVIGGLVWLGGSIAVIAVRGTDRMWQLFYRSEASCPICFQVTPLPVFICPGDHPDDPGTDPRWNLHRDLRPGVLGVFRRRCGCGQRLPTSVRRAVGRLPGLCPVCLIALRSGAGVARDVRIPVFGAKSAGKTHLIAYGLVSMVGVAQANGLPVAATDLRSLNRLQDFRSVVDGRERILQVTSRAQPEALTIEIGVPTDGATRRRRLRQRVEGGRGTLVHLFDAAGEAYADREASASFRFLDGARTLVFAIDPFSIPAVRDRYRPGHLDVFDEAYAASDSVEDSFDVTIHEVRRRGVQTSQKQLAVAVTKFDLLRKIPECANLGHQSGDVRAWLAFHGLEPLLFRMEAHFGTVRFFHTGVTDRLMLGPARPGTAYAPLEWLLHTDRVRLGPDRR
jgi:hypothetical protein